jgi:hypothetical protein
MTMHTLKLVINRMLLSAVIIVQVFFYPAATFASEEATQTQPSETTTQTTEQTSTESSELDPAPSEPVAEIEEPAPTQTVQSTETVEPQTTLAPTTTTGPQSPTGVGNSTYAYNAETGKWENEYYIWDPVTKQTSPKYQQEYSYNPVTGMWDTTEWIYNPAIGKYEPNTVSYSLNSLSGSAISTLSSPASLGPGSSNQTVNDADLNGVFDLFYDSRISNNISSFAATGDASILQNNTAGNALTGNSLALVNLLNILQSSVNPFGGDVNTFVYNIEGDVVGDLYINPQSSLNSNNLAVRDAEANFDINVQNEGRIDNTVRLDAISGDATVEENTDAGSATSGNADAIANIINVINSSISAGESFLGVININGNFEGDILLPENMLETLLASNVPRATLDTSQIENGQLLVDFNNNTSINNDVTATATSGDALIDQNTITTGRATTGDAATNITIFNLTGQEIIGSNAILVFINVMGEWVGIITNAPEGATSAALGGGISQNNFTSNTTANISNDAQINNDVIVNAESGDATVRRNTKAGNATTGDANAGVNILNIASSQLSFSDWFGVLFINVLGSWYGSFGINTAYGNPRLAPSTNSAPVVSDVKVFAFVPGNGNKTRLEPRPIAAYFDGNTEASNQTNVQTDMPSSILAAADTNNHEVGSPDYQQRVNRNRWISMLGTITGVGLLGAERVYSNRHRRDKLGIRK